MHSRRLFLIYLTTSLATPAAVLAAEVKLPAATPVHLVLRQTITSALTPPGAPIWFSVQDDVVQQGQVLIRKGALVKGEMWDGANRRMAGAGANLAFGVRFVPAVDGQQVRVLSSGKVLARDRDNATVGWVIFWGLPGLLTHGTNAYLERGALTEAQVLTDKYINIELSPAGDAAPTATPATDGDTDIAHLRVASGAGAVLKFDLERDSASRDIEFELAPGSGTPVAAEIDVINDWPLPEPIAARAIGTGDKRLSFDGWSIAQYCDTGPANRLHFRLHRADGSELGATYELEVKLARKEKKK